MRFAPGVLVALIAAMAVAGPAAAAPRWSSPEAVYAGGSAADIAVGPDGAALMVGMAVFPATPGGSEVDVRLVAAERAPGAARWSAPRILTGPGEAYGVQMASNAAGEAVFAWLTFVRGLGGPRGATELWAASWSSTGGIEPAKRIAVTSDPIYSPFEVRVNRRGDAAVAWMGDDDIGVAVRRSGEGFGPPERVAPPGGTRGLELALSPVGDVAVGYTGEEATEDVPGARAERNLVSFRPAGGSFGPPEPFSSDRLVSRPQLAFDRDGSLLALYGRSLYGAASPNADEGGVQVTTRPPGGTFGPAVPLEGSASEAFRPDLVQSDSGEIMAIWSERDGDAGYAWRYASRPSGSSFGSVELLALTDVRDNVPRVRLDEHGFGVVAWDQRQHARRSRGTGPSRMIAAVRPPDLLFTRPEPISPFGGVSNAFPAVDGAGRAYVAWKSSCVQVATYGEPADLPAVPTSCFRPSSQGAVPSDAPVVQLSRFEADVSTGKSTLKVRATCDEPCNLRAAGRLSIGRRSTRLAPVPAALGGMKRSAVRIPLSKAAVRLLGSRGPHSPRARLSVRVENGARVGRTTTQSRVVRVR